MLKRAYRYVKGDYLLRNSAILAFGAVATGALNYLFQVMAARMLSVAEYGVLGAFYAILYTVTFSGQSISLFTTKNVAMARSDAQRASVLRNDMLFFGGLALGFFAVYSLLIPVTRSALHVDSVLVIILAGIIMLLSFMSSIITGFGRGVEDFLQPTVSGFISTFLKLALGIGLVMLGFGVAGALAGILVGSTLAVTYLVVLYRRYLAHPGGDVVPISKSEFAWYFLIFSCSILFIDIDVLLVKYFFSEYNAGLYAAVSLIGKVVLFTAGSAVPVMFPRAVKQIEGGNPAGAMRFFWKTVGLAALAGGAVVLAYALVPQLIVSLLYGSKYPIAHLIVYAGIEVLLYVVLSIVVMMALAMKRYAVLWTLLLGLAVQVALIVAYHGQLGEVILWSIAGLAVSVVGCGAIVLGKPARQEHRQRDGGDIAEEGQAPLLPVLEG